MANRTDPNATSVHGTNPQFLIEKIVRLKIHSCSYWKEHCYALSAETLVDKAVELEFIGGTYGGTRKPAPFICLILKMLQLQPEMEIVYEFVKNKDYKYVTALGCFYLRLIGRAEDIYSYLEPLYNDYRKLRLRETDGSYRLIHMDEFVEELIYNEAYCDTVLPRIPKRQILEDNGALQPRHSVLEDIDDDDEALLAEIIGDDKKDDTEGVLAGDGEFIENPRAAVLKVNRNSEERETEERESKKKKEKKEKKEKKKKKYRSRKSLSRSRSKSRRRHESYSSDSRSKSKSQSRSRSRSRSERKKKKSNWKKEYKERKREKERKRSKDSEREERRKKDHDTSRGKENKTNKEEDAKVDENSDEYWLSLRAKLGMSAPQ